MKRVGIILIAITTIGCSQPTTKPKPKAPPPEELYTKNRDIKDDRMRAIAESFDQFTTLSTFVKSGPTLTVYERLPHDVWEPHAYENERQNSETVEIDGSHFYKEPVTLTKEVSELLQTLVSSRSSFIPFQGYKMCGGFHADWCLVWQNGEETHDVQICFGCHEIMAFADGERYLYCDIWDLDRFKSLMDPLQTHRPKPQ